VIHVGRIRWDSRQRVDIPRPLGIRLDFIPRTAVLESLKATEKLVAQRNFRPPNSEVVSASEIASWVYCPEQWRLHYGLGHEPENVASIDRGERFHESTAAVERSSKRTLRLAGILIVVAALLLVVVLLVRR
jgi:hypothetical protein